MSQHESVSSEQSGPEATRPSDLDQSVSSSGLEYTDLESEQFEGKSGLFESVEGFQPVSAIKESLLSQYADVDSAIPPIEDIVFTEPETVCGTDERVRISPCTATPWRWNAKLIITLGNGLVGGGTGWFIGPRTVMTAGHCVFSAANGGWAKSIKVIPGKDAASEPFGSQTATGAAFRSVVGWTSNSDPEYDYGAIILPNGSLGNAVGWFGFAALSDSSLQNLFVNTAGYPGDKPFGTQWFGAGNISQVTARRLSYMIDTFGGQSGSAVWRLLNGQRHAVGVHGHGGCPNKAVRITTEVFNNMVTWKNL
ncbi:MAG: trypsin-like serine peptidase [Pseudonocardiaceae bacterium]